VSDARFYVELPAEEGGCTALAPAVIEGRIIQGGPEAHPFTNPARQALLFDGPPEVTARHSGMYVDAYGGYAEVEGPARMLSPAEYEALIADLEAGR
jgi:hypothetical protein